MKNNLVILLLPAITIYIVGWFVSLDFYWISNSVNAAFRIFLVLLYLGLVKMCIASIEDR